MPTYVYACKPCGHRFEQYQSFTDDALVTCPQCHQDTLRKQFGTVGIAFKGSGFYSTDSRSGSSSSSPSSPSTDAAASTASSSSTSTTSSAPASSTAD